MTSPFAIICIDDRSCFVKSRFTTESGLLTLSVTDINDFALWIGVHYGRCVLDKFEVELINRNLIYACAPVEFAKAVCIERDCGQDGIVWQPEETCSECWGTGTLDDDQDCLACDSRGVIFGSQIKTDFFGLAVAV